MAADGPTKGGGSTRGAAAVAAVAAAACAVVGGGGEGLVASSCSAADSRNRHHTHVSWPPTPQLLLSKIQTHLMQQCLDTARRAHLCKFNKACFSLDHFKLSNSGWQRSSCPSCPNSCVVPSTNLLLPLLPLVLHAALRVQVSNLQQSSTNSCCCCCCLSPWLNIRLKSLQLKNPLSQDASKVWDVCSSSCCCRAGIGCCSCSCSTLREDRSRGNAACR